MFILKTNKLICFINNVKTLKLVYLLRFCYPILSLKAYKLKYTI